LLLIHLTDRATIVDRIHLLVIELGPDKEPLGFFAIVRMVKEAMRALGVELDDTKLRTYLNLLKGQDVLRREDGPEQVTLTAEGAARKLYRVDMDHPFVRVPLDDFQKQTDV